MPVPFFSSSLFLLPFSPVSPFSPGNFNVLVWPGPGKNPTDVDASISYSSCTCKSIKFVQTVITTETNGTTLDDRNPAPGWYWPFTGAPTNAPFYFDSTQTGSYKTGIQTGSMGDAPGFKPGPLGGLGTPDSFAFAFETCAVCADSGPPYKILGCRRWGFTKHSNGTFTMSGQGTNLPGQAPSQIFLNTVGPSVSP